MEKERVLIIKLGALGDFVISVGGMLSLRKKHPNARFTLMTGSLYVNIARHMGLFDDYIIDNRNSYWDFADKLRLARQLKKGKFDYIYDFQCTSRTENRYFTLIKHLYTKPFIWHDQRKALERVVTPRSCFLPSKVEMREATPLPVERDRLEFMHAAPGLVESLPRPYVLMIPGCSPTHPHKRWPAASYGALAHRLAEHGIYTVAIGTRDEAAEVRCVAAASDKVVSLLNKISLADIPDLARHALAAVGNDTGPSHMAAVTGSPLIGLFATRTKKCSLQGRQTHNIISPGTIDLISPETVWDALLPFIGPHLKK